MKHLNADNDTRGMFRINLTNKRNIRRDKPVLGK